MRPATVILPPAGVKILGIIEFVHGMCDHRYRYNHVLKYFSNKGFICAIADMRGHGENILTNDDLGYFGKDGFNGLVDDVVEYTTFLKREYPNIPIILVGHSMGSLIVRSYLKRHSKDIDGLVVCGSPSNISMINLGKILLKVMSLFAGQRYRSPFINGLVNNSFENTFKKEGILHAWLCSDLEVADKFNKDDKCNFIFTLNGFSTLLNLMQSVYGKDGWRSKNAELPVMFISGANDPCRINDKKFKASVTHLKRMGYPKTFSNLYPEMRHELFNETGRKEVFEDILKFIEIKVGVDMQ